MVPALLQLELAAYALQRWAPALRVFVAVVAPFALAVSVLLARVFAHAAWAKWALQLAVPSWPGVVVVRGSDSGRAFQSPDAVGS